MQRIYATFDGSVTPGLGELAAGLLSDQKRTWEALRIRYDELGQLSVRKVALGTQIVILQYNPKRSRSTGADTDPHAVRARSCFLCGHNLPSEQQAVICYRSYRLLCNPFPIFTRHFTIAHLRHRSQSLMTVSPVLLKLARDLHPDLALLYNGPASGASAPDHLHLQAVPRRDIPAIAEAPLAREPVLAWRGDTVLLYRTVKRHPPAFIVEGNDPRVLHTFLGKLIAGIGENVSAVDEPMMNLFCVYDGGTWRIILFPRRKHRPDCYYAQGDEHLFISPGAVDVGGLLVLPREKDFARIDAAMIERIYQEISPGEEVLTRIVDEMRRSLGTRRCTAGHHGEGALEEHEPS